MIHTLKSNAFAGVLTPPKVTGLGPIFRAKIRVAGESLRCYVKPLPDFIDCPLHHAPVTNQEMVNEALGYVLAKACGFAVPDAAGIILLDQARIPDTALVELRKLGRGKLQDNYFCWFTKDMAFPNLVQRHMGGIKVPFMEQRRIKRIAKSLVAAKETAKIIAFDDWLLNSDRHPGNLLDGSQGLILIDQGRILMYPNWVPGGLGSVGHGQVFVNRLRNFIDAHEPHWSEKLPKKSEIVMAYNAFAVDYRDRGEQHARNVLAHFFDSVDIDAIIHLLRSRHDTAAYAKASGMVI